MSTRFAHLPDLDSLRALAVTIVVLYHFLPAFGLGSLPAGWLGVDLFFILSGFLITVILLYQKAADGRPLHVIRNFIIRRALRLFPAYYLFISFFALLQATVNLWSWAPGDAIWYYTYTSNVLKFLEGGARASQVSHLWSLAVEEQFYLFWPWVVMFLNTRTIRNLLLVAIPLGFGLKCAEITPEFRVLTPSNLNTLGLGALMALYHDRKTGWLAWARSRRGVASLIGLSMLLLLFRSFVHVHVINNALLELAFMLIAGTLITSASQGFHGLSIQISRHPLVLRLGVISYGLYLYHMPMPLFLNLANEQFGLGWSPYSLFAIALLLTVIVAELSYRFIESPFLRIKERFDV